MDPQGITVLFDRPTLAVIHAAAYGRAIAGQHNVADLAMLKIIRAIRAGECQAHIRLRNSQGAKDAGRTKQPAARREPIPLAGPTLDAR